MRFPLTLAAPMLTALAALAAGCGDPAPISARLTDSTLTLTTERFNVGPGDIFECFYTSYFTEREMTVQDAFGQQGPGGHHIVVYYTTHPRPPGHHPCTDEEMVEWHQIAGAGGEGAEGASVGLPEGLAFRVPQGVQIVAQMHYINTTGKDYGVEDTVTLRFGDPAKLKAYANYMFTNDGTFEVPTGRRMQRASTCVLPRDLNVVLLLGHMHEHGTHFKLERVDEAGASMEVLYDEGWLPLYASHPPLRTYPMDSPMKLAKGTRLRQTCDWDNTTAAPLLFPREMCVTFMYYYPDMGEVECPIVSNLTNGQ